MFITIEHKNLSTLHTNYKCESYSYSVNTDKINYIDFSNKTIYLIGGEKIKIDDENILRNFANQLYEKTANTQIINELRDWVQNNSDKKMSSWDFINNLLESKGAI